MSAALPTIPGETAQAYRKRLAIAAQFPCDVKCNANRGKTYHVCFDADGNIQTVYVDVHAGESPYLHALWRVESGKEMTTTVACAARAALAKLEAKAYEQLP